MKPLKILLVDDDEAVVAPVAEYLSSEGHEVVFVQTGVAAVEAFRTVHPDLVLIDLTMPGMEGLSAIKQMRKVTTQIWIPIIVITGSDDEGDVLTSFIAGADDYISKPINPLVLGIRIQAMMRIVYRQMSSQAALDGVIEGVVQIDCAGRMTAFNKAAEKIFGYTQHEVIGQNVKLLMPSPYRENHDEYIGNFVATGCPKVIGIGRQVVGLRKNGEVFPMHLGVTEIHTPDDRFFIGLVRDLTVEQELEKVQRDLERVSQCDDLTGVANRRHFYALAKQDVSRSARYGGDTTLLLLDVDQLKAFNDTYGFEVGDGLLKVVSDVLRNTLRDVDIIGRLGGDEFAVVLPNTPVAQGREVALRISQACAAQPMLLPVVSSVGFSLSIGLSGQSGPDANLDLLLREAERALVSGKRKGVGQIVVFDPLT